VALDQQGRQAHPRFGGAPAAIAAAWVWSGWCGRWRIVFNSQIDLEGGGKASGRRFAVNGNLAIPAGFAIDIAVDGCRQASLTSF